MYILVYIIFPNFSGTTIPVVAEIQPSQPIQRKLVEQLAKAVGNDKQYIHARKINYG